PTVALMPDITPPPLRSKANGVINLMGGFGALLAFFLGSQLYRISPALPFVFGGVVMVLVTLLLRRQIVEPATVEGSGEAKGSVGILSALREVWADPDDSARAMLAAIFFWFVGWSGIEAFFTLYGREMWGISEAAGAFYLGFFSLSLMVFAVPAGFVGTGIGRGRTIRIGLACLVLALFALALIGRESLAVPALRILTRMFGGSITEAGYPAIVEWVLVRLSLIMPILLAFAGASWALININSYPMVVDM
ncbi:MAG: MFS transporter, partial [Firmicutes bacterium]|nr:MFS transporter [Bacillota bacterium]